MHHSVAGNGTCHATRHAHEPAVAVRRRSTALWPA